MGSRLLLKQAEQEVDLLSRPYAERQLIVVLSDEEIKAQQKYKEKQEESGFAKMVSSVSSLIFPTSLIIAEATIELYKAILSLREQGIKTLSVSQSVLGKLSFLLDIQGSVCFT